MPSTLDDELDSVSSALSELAGVLVDQEDLGDLLQRVAELARVAVPGCSAASITLIDTAGPRTVAHAGEVALELDQVQYDLDEGPCIEAISQVRQIALDLADADQHWREFAEASRALGVRSFFASPLIAGGRAVGALNLFSHSEDGPLDSQAQLVEMFCARASVALANAQLYAHALSLADQLQTAIERRAVIEQAKGVLMARTGLDAEQAFALLRAQSQRENRKLRDVAVEVVQSTAR